VVAFALSRIAGRRRRFYGHTISNRRFAEQAFDAERPVVLPPVKGVPMRPSSPLPANQVEVYRPACAKCGSRMMLARIEPSGRSDYDTRTFECGQCGHELRKVVRFT